MAKKKLRVKVALECMREMDDGKIWKRDLSKVLKLHIGIL